MVYVFDIIVLCIADQVFFSFLAGQLEQLILRPPHQPLLLAQRKLCQSWLVMRNPRLMGMSRLKYLMMETAVPMAVQILPVSQKRFLIFTLLLALFINLLVYRGLLILANST